MYFGSVLDALPPELVPVDRILLRWSVAVGDGIRADQWDEKRRSLPPPLPDDLAIIVDQAILKSPERTRRLIVKWYKSPKPTYVLAEELRMDSRKLLQYWKLCLNFMRWKLEGTKHPALLEMLRVRV